MKKYRIMYWLGSVATDCYIKANSKQDALMAFKRRKGRDKDIIKIEEA